MTPPSFNRIDIFEYEMYVLLSQFIEKMGLFADSTTRIFSKAYRNVKKAR